MHCGYGRDKPGRGVRRGQNGQRDGLGFGRRQSEACPHRGRPRGACGANPLPAPARREQVRRGTRGGASVMPAACRARRHHDRRAVGRVPRPCRGRRLSGRHDAERHRRRGAVLWREVGLSRLHPRRRARTRRGVGQLARERRADRAGAARRLVDRCRNDDDRSRSAQGRSASRRAAIPTASGLPRASWSIPGWCARR